MSLLLLAALQIQLGAIPGALAILVEGDREPGIESDDAGRFHFHNLSYGRYLLRVHAAYNFSNPFSGKHFGHPRLISARLKLAFPR